MRNVRFGTFVRMCRLCACYFLLLRCSWAVVATHPWLPRVARAGSTSQQIVGIPKRELHLQSKNDFEELVFQSPLPWIISIVRESCSKNESIRKEWLDTAEIVRGIAFAGIVDSASPSSSWWRAHYSITESISSCPPNFHSVL